MKYIHDYLKPGDHILDIGAGTGRYSVALNQEVMKSMLLNLLNII